MEFVSLINMPFGSIHRPSLAITQLKALGARSSNHDVLVDTIYVNFDFAHYLGETLYEGISNSLAHASTGFGDWFFRQAAFPDYPDNEDEYYERYYPTRRSRSTFRRLTEQKRRGVIDVLYAIVDRYKLTDRGIVGFTSAFNQNTASFALARILKLLKPSIITVMGGPNCESEMGKEISEKVEAIDYVFSGSALQSFPEFLKCYLSKDISRRSQIDGVFSKLTQERISDGANASGTVGSLRVRDRGVDLPVDARIPLDYSDFLVRHKREFGSKKPAILFETSRGCWWGEKAHCTFCGLNGDSMSYRAMSASNAIAQFEEIFQYADDSTYFECVDNIMPKTYVKEVFSSIQAPRNTEIFYEVKADLREDDLKILANAGVTTLQPGIESLSTETLRLMRKGTTAPQNIMFLKHCTQYGIRPIWNLLFGFPGEKEASYLRHLEYIPKLTHLFPPWGVYPVRFDRFSPYHSRPEEFGLQLRPMEFYDYIYPKTIDTSKLAYFFVNRTEMPHNKLFEHFRGDLSNKCRRWMQLWLQADKFAQPRLFCVPNTNLVEDSRSGNTLLRDIGPHGRILIDILGKPKTMAIIQREVLGVRGFDAEAEMSALVQSGLIFEEGDHYLSLVHPVEPANFALTIERLKQVV